MKRIKFISILALLLTMTQGAWAQSSTASVSTCAELSAAIADASVTTIIVTADIDVPCGTSIAKNGGTDYTGASTCQLTINRSLSIQSQAGNKFKIRRTVADGAVAYNLKSLFGIRGNGTGTGNEHVTSNTVAVEMKNIIIDGGAEWGASTLAQRYTNTTTGAYVRAGRSIIDVYLGAMLNLEDGAEIQNGLCTNSGSTYNDGQGTWNYGAAVRVDYTHDYGGGTVNIKAGAKIHDCSTSYIRSYMNDSDVSVGIGGALGAYNYAYLNIYGGSIYNCSSRRGGAIGCRYRGTSGYTQTTAGVVKMYGGSVYNCESVEGGAFCLIGQSSNYLLGGSITNCSATNGGAVSIPEGNGPTLNIVAKTSGFLTISDCTNTNETSIASPLDYKYIYKKVGTISEAPVYQVTFRSDGADFAVLSVVQGLSLGEAFPASPFKGDYRFVGWYNGNTEVTSSTAFNENTTVTARWDFFGSGTEGDPYQIMSVDNWNTLSTNVNGGNTYSGNYFKMTANVGTVETWMTGTFSGTFDGDGNTLTVDYSATTEKCAPFGTLGGASIQKLKVAGTITTNQKYAAGIAAYTTGTTYITNCLSSVAISSAVSGDGTHGGLVAVVDDVASLSMTGCAFTGKLLTTNSTTSCGGFVGFRWYTGTLTMTDCLYAPASATGSETWISDGEGQLGNANFSRWSNSTPTFTRCYYTTDFGSGKFTAQGIQARTIAAGDYVSTLSVTKGSATATYAVSGITVYSGGIDFNDGSTTTFYGGSGQTVSLTLTAETRTGYQFKQYAASQGTLSGETTNTPTLTMPAANSTANDVVTITAEYDPTYNATFADASDASNGWSISPTSGIVGSTVTVSYTGENKVKSVTVTKLALCSLSEVTNEHVGKIIGADGNVYASLAQAEKVTSAVGVLGKVTETGHGLIMSLEDAPQQVWATIDGWASASYAGTTLKVLPDDDARGSNLPSYTTLGSTTVSNWAVATRADYTAIFTNLGSTGGDYDGISYDANMNAKITGAGGTAISGENWSSTQYDSSMAWRFASTWGGRSKTDQYKVRPVLGF